jgi:peptidoglycan hydrolase-like protein with peptidoglycan-binding domain
MKKSSTVLRRAGVGLATVLMATAGLVVSTGTASAAAPACVKMVPRGVPSGTIEVPAASNGHQTCLIQRGSANRGAVFGLQRTMVKCYGGLRMASPYQNEKIQGLSADGDFGPRTEAALKAVQAYARVTVDGSYGPVTRDHMRFISTNGRNCYAYL